MGILADIGLTPAKVAELQPQLDSAADQRRWILDFFMPLCANSFRDRSDIVAFGFREEIADDIAAWVRAVTVSGVKVSFGLFVSHWILSVVGYDD